MRLPESPPDANVWGAIQERARARVMVVQADTGALVWQGKPDDMAPLTLAARNNRIFYSNYEQIVCLDAVNGQEIWRSQEIKGRTGHRGTVGTLVAHDKVVLFTPYPVKGMEDSGRLHVFSVDKGDLLWQGPKYVGPGVTNPPDLFVADGLVWLGETKLPVSHNQVELSVIVCINIYVCAGL